MPGGGPLMPGGGPLIGGPPIIPPRIPGGGPRICIPPGGPGILGLGAAWAAKPPRPCNTKIILYIYI